MVVMFMTAISPLNHIVLADTYCTEEAERRQGLHTNGRLTLTLTLSNFRLDLVKARLNLTKLMFYS